MSGRVRMSDAERARRYRQRKADRELAEKVEALTAAGDQEGILDLIRRRGRAGIESGAIKLRASDVIKAEEVAWKQEQAAKREAAGVTIAMLIMGYQPPAHLLGAGDAVIEGEAVEVG